ncbi:MAG: FAD-dependent oxidoreductase [Mycobacteriales bacterium]
MRVSCDPSKRCEPSFIWPVGSRPEELLYGFPAIDGSDGGLKVASEQYTASTTPDAVRREVGRLEAAEMYDRCIRGRLPALAPRAVKSTACLYTATPDFGFVIDRHPRNPNVIVCSPCSGHGFKHSAAVGEVVAALATGGTTDIDITPFSLRRFAA